MPRFASARFASTFRVRFPARSYSKAVVPVSGFVSVFRRPSSSYVMDVVLLGEAASWMATSWPSVSYSYCVVSARSTTPPSVASTRCSSTATVRPWASWYETWVFPIGSTTVELYRGAPSPFGFPKP